MRKSKAKLPDPRNMPIIQLLNMSYEELALHLKMKRTLNNEHSDRMTIYLDEAEWVDDLIDVDASLRLLLETITVGELITWGLKYKKIEKRAGAKQNKERRAAWVMINGFGQSQTAVWENYLLPELIKQGKLNADDLSRIESEKAAFDKYIDRERAKLPEIPPKKRQYFGVLP